MNNFEEYTKYDVIIESEEIVPSTLLEHINYFFFGDTDIALADGLFYYGVLSVAFSSLFVILISCFNILV